MTSINVGDDVLFEDDNLIFDNESDDQLNKVDTEHAQPNDGWNRLRVIFGLPNGGIASWPHFG